ncbi:hypothetical protein BDD12DRAFT_897289 [Trichophaea hybrida]|nr:hypothetical protein BDD12DRAFT_897289 [Trichophaea hybrida]
MSTFQPAIDQSAQLLNDHNYFASWEMFDVNQWPPAAHQPVEPLEPVNAPADAPDAPVLSQEQISFTDFFWELNNPADQQSKSDNHKIVEEPGAGIISQVSQLEGEVEKLRKELSKQRELVDQLRGYISELVPWTEMLSEQVKDLGEVMGYVQESDMD